MLPDGESNPGRLTYESGALPIALCSPATIAKGAYSVCHLANFVAFSDIQKLGLLTLKALSKNCSR